MRNSPLSFCAARRVFGLGLSSVTNLFLVPVRLDVQRRPPEGGTLRTGDLTAVFKPETHVVKVIPVTFR
jgi:hypothetical protein